MLYHCSGFHCHSSDSGRSFRSLRLSEPAILSSLVWQPDRSSEHTYITLSLIENLLFSIERKDKFLHFWGRRRFPNFSFLTPFPDFLTPASLYQIRSCPILLFQSRYRLLCFLEQSSFWCRKKNLEQLPVHWSIPVKPWRFNFSFLCLISSYQIDLSSEMEFLPFFFCPNWEQKNHFLPLGLTSFSLIPRPAFNLEPFLLHLGHFHWNHSFFPFST